MDWLGAVLGVGGAAFIAAVFQGVKMIRDGNRQKEQQDAQSMSTHRAELENRAKRAEAREAQALAEADFQRRMAAYHLSRVAMRDYIIIARGYPLPEDPPMPLPMNLRSEPPAEEAP